MEPANTGIRPVVRREPRLPDRPGRELEVVVVVKTSIHTARDRETRTIAVLVGATSFQPRKSSAKVARS